MRTTIVLALIGLLGGCASFRQPEPPKKVAPPVQVREKRVTTPVKRPVAKRPSQVQSRAVWHLISPQIMELVLRHQESGKNEFIRVETTLSDLELPPGLYRIESVIVGGEKYDALEGQELFQFEVSKKAPTYIGSYVIECPKVGPVHLDELRKMKFFNRLNFTGQPGACEMIVGNDLPNVRRAWSRLERVPGTKLQLGF